MDDTISRQAAIDALHTWFRDGFDEDKWWNSTHVLAAIEGLPSVQQDYKWETCFECPLSHGCPKIKGCTNEQAIEYASQIPNDCPLSARPVDKDINVPNNDIISRQAAIEAVEKLDIPEDMCVFEILSHVELAITTLPSTDPEIIRCKDCKYVSFEPCKDYEDVYVCNRNYWTREQGGNMPNDFCSHGERRKRKEE